MTVDASPSFKRYPYTGLGGYSFSFQTYKERDISVVYLGTSGQPLLLVKDIDYRVTLSFDFSGGEVTLLETDTTRSLVDGSLTISRELPFKQDVEFINNHAFPMPVIEVSFDRLVMMIQQLNTVVSEGTIIINWRGDWVPGVDYNTQDMVVYSNGNWYVCVTKHTSTAFVDDLALGYWIIALNIEEVAVLTDRAEVAALGAEASEGNSAASAVQSGLSEVNAEGAAQESANCRQESYNQAVISTVAADRAEAAANVIPNPIGEDPGDIVQVNPTSDGWVFSPLAGVEADLGAPSEDGMVLSSTTAKVRSWIKANTNRNVISGAYKTGGIDGGEFRYVSSSTFNVSAVSTTSGSGNTPLFIDATTLVDLVTPAIDEIYHVFVCQNLDDSYTIETDTDIDGATLPAAVVSKRWLFPVFTNSSGAIIALSMADNRMSLHDVGSIPIGTLGTTFTKLFLNAFIPTERIITIDITSANAAPLYSSHDGVNTSYAGSVDINDGGQYATIVNHVLGGDDFVWLKVGGGSPIARIVGLSLRR